jgi:hypothetical protein
MYSFLVEVTYDAVERGPGGYPTKKPVYATIDPRPVGYWVHAGAEHGRDYALACARALAETCRGKISDEKGKLLEDLSWGQPATWDSLVQAWGALDAALAAKEQLKRDRVRRKWERESAADPRTAAENDWGDV